MQLLYKDKLAVVKKLGLSYIWINRQKPFLHSKVIQEAAGKILIFHNFSTEKKMFTYMVKRKAAGHTYCFMLVEDLA